jgi:hypothetical protein
MGLEDYECECLICGARLDGQPAAARMLHAMTEHPIEVLQSPKMAGTVQGIVEAVSKLGEKAAEKTLELLK